MNRLFLSKGYIIFTRIFITIAIIIIIFPLAWMLSLSFRENNHLYEAYGFFIPKYFTFTNYADAFDFFNTVIEASFFKLFLNSAIVTSSALFLTIIVSILASYAFSNLKFRIRNTVYMTLVISIMIPAQILLIPLYYLFSKLNIINNPVSLIIAYTAFGIPISVLILTSFFGSIPKELKDSATIDGASNITYLLKIVLPLSKAAIATCIIFLFLFFWNEFLLANIFISRNSLKTLPAGMSLIVGSRYAIPWGTYAAAVNISIIPILIVFIIFQKWFIEGVTLGALKG